MSDVPEPWIEGLKEIVSRIDQVVVSLDRIGSARVSTEAERAALLEQFMTEWEVFKSLAKARRVGLELLRETVSAGDVDTDEDFVDQLGIVERPAWPEK